MTHSVFPSFLETNFPRCCWPSEPELTVALAPCAPRRDGSSILFGIVFLVFHSFATKEAFFPAFLGLEDPIALFLGRKKSTKTSAVDTLALILALRLIIETDHSATLLDWSYALHRTFGRPASNSL